MRIVCAGHVNWDVTLRLDRLPAPDDESVVEDERSAGGGSAANVAAALASLDSSVTLLGSVGDDDRGSRVRSELRAAGVDCDHVVVVPGETATKYLLVGADGEVAVLARAGANEAYTAADLPGTALDNVTALHLTGQSPATAAALAERARARGLIVSVAPGRRVGDRDFDTVLAAADIAFLNDREAATVLRDGGPLDRTDATVVVTRGGEGAEVRTDGRVVEHPGYSVDATDATGGGDAFAAGFLATRLDGARLRPALAVANACGAIATTVPGARARLDRAAVRDLIDTDTPAGF